MTGVLQIELPSKVLINNIKVNLLTYVKGMNLLTLVLKQQKFILQETESCALNEVLNKALHLMEKFLII